MPRKIIKIKKKEKMKELSKKVTSAVVDAIDCPAEAVYVVINEVDKDNWGIGGVPVSTKFPDS